MFPSSKGRNSGFHPGNAISGFAGSTKKERKIMKGIHFVYTGELTENIKKKLEKLENDRKKKLEKLVSDYRSGLLKI